MLIKDLEPAAVKRVAALLDEALDLPFEERATWQKLLAEREPHLVELVSELLASMPSKTADSGAPEHAGAVLRAVPNGASLQGRMFGPWRVLRLLGQGGMGSVWLAERADGLFERQVALKLVHSGLFGDALRERFARERSILAALEHPLIARLLDAGIADDSQPYLAIEYVEGTTLTTHCDALRLPIDARLALMTQVLSAVQHAHRNLVLHRDLKPANILVTPGGQVRLLDFGIAKLLIDGEVHETELTHMGGRALTPEFASPEQIAGLPLSTASDVYSLGVVLYVLLCGQRPYRLQRDSRSALEEAIVSAQAIKPSQQELSDAAADARGTTPQKLARTLAGDLDTIVLKAIKKDPAERYETADELMRELQRYLAGVPVHARPDSLAYRCAKFVARNRVQVGLGMLLGLVILLAAGVSIWSGQIARQQARVAQTEAQRARTVERFVLDIFKANSDDQLDPLRARQTTARELLDVGAQRAAESLKDSPEAQHEVLETLADMYSQLGLNVEAAKLREQRIASVRQSYGPHHVKVADALLSFVDDIALTNDRARAVPALAEAEQILDRIGDYASERRGHLWVTSADLEQYFSLDLMRRHADRGLQHFRVHPGSWSSSVIALQVSAKAHQLAGAYDRAEADNRAALEQVSRHDPESTWAVTPLTQLAEVQYSKLQLADAEENFRTALELSRRINGDESCVTLQTRAKLGEFLHATARGEEARALLEGTQAIILAQNDNATPDSISVLRINHGRTLQAEGRVAEAERSFAEELAYRRKYFPGSLPLSQALLLHADSLSALGRHDASAAELSEAWQLWQKSRGQVASPETTHPYLLAQARLALARGQLTAAEEALRAIAQPADEKQLNLDAFAAKLTLAQLRVRQERWEEAEQLAQASLSQLRASALRERFPRLEAEAALRVGQARRHADPRGACTELARAVQLRAAEDLATSPWLAEAEAEYADCQRDQAGPMIARGQER